MPANGFQRILTSPASAYEEGLLFFRGKGMVNETLRRLARDLERQGIDYVVIGAIALNQHGYRRFTEDIALILSNEGLEAFRRDLVGRGYRPAVAGASRKFPRPTRTSRSRSSRAATTPVTGGQSLSRSQTRESTQS